MEIAINALFGILSFGSIIVLVVLGLGVIVSMMGIFNFAHGEFVLLGAYTTYLFYSWGLPVLLGMAFAPFVVAVIGVFLERTVIRRFYAAPVAAMLGTYAIGLAIREGIRGLIGGLYLSVPEPLIGSFEFGDISLPRWRVVIILVTIVVVVGSYLLLTRTLLGLRVRAALENPALARASGISTSRMYAVTFAFGAALAGLAGALMVPLFSLFADLGHRAVDDVFDPFRRDSGPLHQAIENVRQEPVGTHFAEHATAPAERRAHRIDDHCLRSIHDRRVRPPRHRCFRRRSSAMAPPPSTTASGRSRPAAQVSHSRAVRVRKILRRSSRPGSRNPSSAASFFSNRGSSTATAIQPSPVRYRS